METTITIDRRLKVLLELAKSKYGKELGMKLSWNDFMEKVVLKKLEMDSLLELSDDEAKLILDLTARGRGAWRQFV